MDVVAKLGKRLKIIRIATGVKQKDLAKELNIPAPLLSMYEKGSREPPLSFLNQFANHFQLPMSQLFSLLDEKYGQENNEISALMKDMKSLLLNLEKESLIGRKHVLSA
jgi:transcriptional regulator with XRE-family HTH domain